MLTAAQIVQYRESGFLVIDDVLPPTEVAELRTAVADPEVSGALEEHGYSDRTVHLLELTTRHPLFLRLARHPAIIARIAPLLGPDIQLQHSKLAAKPPAVGKGHCNWHQDFAFFPHTNSDLCAVMVMLDDATPDNGCMRMLPGSHRLGLLDHHGPDGWFASGCQERWALRDDSKAVAITPRAGGISIHHALTLHGSPGNASGRPRRGLLYQNRPPDAIQHSH
jgi:ectoine hydroxylase-related dioxygenase (phytanoyl-CoA dioxygenase family)